MLRLLPKRAQTRARAPVSTIAAIRLRELQQELQAARPAHHHRTSAAKAPVPWLLPWSSPLRTSCGASSARSSICAYSLLVAHLCTTEQSASRDGRDTRGSMRSETFNHVSPITIVHKEIS